MKGGMQRVYVEGWQMVASIDRCLQKERERQESSHKLRGERGMKSSLLTVQQMVATLQRKLREKKVADGCD
jgi:hypothetical protein